MNDVHSDEGTTLHGSKASPLPVPLRLDYLQWEYKEMGDAIGQKGKRLHQSLLQDHGCMIDRIVVEVPEQGRHVFYFDVTQNILSLGNAVKEHDANLLKARAIPGRNELCPCGSQKKYKKCCGK